MKNKSLAQDYLERCQHRLVSVETLEKRGSWADVVRESQEIIELALKGLLRHSDIEVPRIHDVSDVMMNHISLIDKKLHPHLEKMGEISRRLRRDRELAFYGSEDLTPSEFYKKRDATQALEDARWTVGLVARVVLKARKIRQDDSTKE